MAFTKKYITVSFQMQGAPLKTVSGLRVSCQIVNAGPPSMGQADVAIYGMTLSDMNTLSTVGTQMNMVGQNFIAIYAGDDPNNLPLVFQGTIAFAWADIKSQPQAAFRVTALAGAYQNAAPMAPTSVQGQADVATVMQQLAQQMGLGFESSGFDVKVSNPYLPGTGLEQVKRLAQAAGVLWTVDNDTLVVVKPGESRSAGAVLISPQTGMVGYPTFNQAGVIVESMFNPNFRQFARVTIQSDITPACGTWVICNISHNIESETPNGAWFTTMLVNGTGQQASEDSSAD
jgi:hypothetical protein